MAVISTSLFSPQECIIQSFFNPQFLAATDPSRKLKASEVNAQKKKDGGFKTAPDGRLIITDDAFDDGDDNEPRPSGDIDTDTDDTGEYRLKL